MTVTRLQVRNWKARIDVARDMLGDVAGEIAAEAVRAGEASFDPLASAAADLVASNVENTAAIQWLTRFVEPYAIDDQRAAS